MNFKEEKNSTKRRNLSNGKISDRIIEHLENNQDRLITRFELVMIAYGNSVNLSFKKRYIDNCLYKEIKPYFKNKGFEIETVRRIGLKLVKT